MIIGALVAMCVAAVAVTAVVLLHCRAMRKAAERYYG